VYNPRSSRLRNPGQLRVERYPQSTPREGVKIGRRYGVKVQRRLTGEVGHAGSWYPAEHDPIIDSGTFDRVQAQLAAHSAGRTGKRRRTGSLLAGLIYDDRGTA